MNAALAAPSGWLYGGHHPLQIFTPPPRGGALGDVLPTHIRQGLAAISTAGKETRELAEAASDEAARIVGLHVDATGKKGIKIDLVVARGELRDQRQFNVTTLSSQLLRQLVLKAVEDGADMLLVEPASMLRDAGLLAKARTPLADQLVSDHLKVARHDGH